MNIFKKKKTLPSAFTVIKQKTQILSWWGSGNQGKHLEKWSETRLFLFVFLIESFFFPNQYLDKM